ncbi:hypothetical protein Spiaf_0480 [Spirochaeta africana DSM 8902]|uniref:Periplasmic/secreted protein n=2 Tax=Spirochaeta TaxID=146 RepID=H9UGE0_SPIAZ|nr:hypothetical protein Spiaf_0480 [Spirochaeta africana DSM 8902]
MVIAALVLTAPAVFARGSAEAGSPPSISVAGEGAVTLSPDIASLQVAVETEHPQAQNAVQDNANRMQALFQSLELLNITRDSIQTTGYQVSVQRPQQRTSPQGDDQPQEPYYRVTNTVRITLEDTDLVGAVIDTVFSAGATHVRNVQFGVSSTAEAELEALELAMQHARDKARRIAEAQGAELGPALWINEEYGGGMPRQQADMMLYARAESTPIAAGDYTVSARVQVTFELR